MSARAWDRRRYNQRFVLAVNRAIKQIAAEPWQPVLLEDYGVVVMSPNYHDDMLDDVLPLLNMTNHLLDLAEQQDDQSPS